MKITKRQLKRIIKEELENLNEYAAECMPGDHQCEEEAAQLARQRADYKKSKGLQEQGGREAELKALASQMGGSLEFANDQGDGQGRQRIIYFDVEPEAYPPGTDSSEFQYAPNERNNPDAGGILYTGYFV